MTARDRFLAEFPKAINDDAAAIFVGAGVSTGAGYPTWRKLLQDIGKELGVDAGDVADLAALAQWSVRKSAGRTRVNNVIHAEIAPDRPIPDPLKTLARLPLRNIWTTNYDRLMERAFAEIGRPIQAISSTAELAIKPRPGAARLFKMHGSIERVNDVVIATDDYELYRMNRGAFLPLLQSHMTSFSMLFMGLSFTDPNVRHVLSLIRESFTSSPPEHFAIVKPPQRDEYKTAREFQARLTQHRLWSDDLLRYGLNVVEIEAYSDVAGLMREVERRVASNRVWISGSWPMAGGPLDQFAYVYDIASAIGEALAERDFALVSGGGVTVGSASVAGFLTGLQRKGCWDLERRLIARPFPQPMAGRTPDPSHWASLRSEMARTSGAVVFLGGAKWDGSGLVNAEGVRDEFEAARKAGAFLLPVGCTGGAAYALADELLKSAAGGAKKSFTRPTKDELRMLMRRESPRIVAGAVLSVLEKRS